MRLRLQRIGNGIGVLAALAALGAPARARSIDALESPSGWSTFADSGSSVAVSTVTGDAGNALQLTYDLTVGHYVGITKIHGYRDFSAADGLEFSYRATGPGNTGQIALIDSDGPTTITSDNLVYKFPLITDNQWRTLIVPLAGFALFPNGNASFNNAQVAKFSLGVTKDNGAAGMGTVFFDGVRVVASTTPVAVVDHFDVDLPQAGYITATPGPSVATVALSFVQDPTSPAAGLETQVARLDYTFAVDPSTPFAVAERSLSVNLLAEPVVRFRFKGTGGNQNLEVKVTDADGTVYMKKLIGVTDTGGAWKTASLPVEGFSFVAAGADSLLDLRNIVKIDFALSTGENAAGTFVLDTLESVRPPDFDKPNAGRVLTRVTTPRNPFSPNGDGVKDAFDLAYTLSQSARVTLKLYRLNGSLVKTLDAGALPAGDHALHWDGVGDDGRPVNNGLCLFVLEADGFLDGKETYKQIVGVLR